MTDPFGSSARPGQIEFWYQMIRLRIENGREIPRYLGMRSTLELAQERAEHFLIPPSDTCRWVRLSDTTWSLMDGAGDTGLMVRKIKKPEEREG